ncbi:hypothetical protein N7461_005576 [Penicillium sp. DV-2018c]|nr:hypothetical protein N7461_005576 [Penicillium sp. DV-2018c]
MAEEDTAFCALNTLSTNNVFERCSENHRGFSGSSDVRQMPQVRAAGIEKVIQEEESFMLPSSEEGESADNTSGQNGTRITHKLDILVM